MENSPSTRPEGAEPAAFTPPLDLIRLLQEAERMRSIEMARLIKSAFGRLRLGRPASRNAAAELHEFDTAAQPQSAAKAAEDRREAA